MTEPPNEDVKPRDLRAANAGDPTRSIGVGFPAHADVEALPAFAQRTEELGFGELWLIEDCFLSGGLVMAATALAATSHVRVIKYLPVWTFLILVY